jgi:hypothetical protein
MGWPLSDGADPARIISNVSNPHELRDYGLAHPVMKMFFERAPKELESKLPQPIGSRSESLVVTRQPGLQRWRQWERC